MIGADTANSRRGAGVLLALALASGMCSVQAGCHNEYIGYSKYAGIDDSVDFVLLEGDLYYLLAHTLRKRWTPPWPYESGSKLVDRVDYLVTVRNALGQEPMEIRSVKRSTAGPGSPGKDLLLFPGRPGDPERVRVALRAEFEDGLCEDPNLLRDYAFSPQRSHWLAVCGEELVLFERDARTRIVEDLAQTIPFASFSKYGTGHQKLFLSEDGRRVVVANVYDLRDGALEFTLLQVDAGMRQRRVRIPLPAQAQVMDVAVTDSEVLAMVEFWPELPHPEIPDGSVRQAVLSMNGGLYPVRLQADGVDEDKIGRYTWDPSSNAIVVHRRVSGDEGDRLLIYAYDYVRRIEKVAWLPHAELLDDRIGEE